MKRILLYIVLLGLALLVPVERADVGKLRPVETIAVYQEGDLIVLRTDTGDTGIGTTAMQALQNMKDTACGIIYLDTARYLLVEEGTEHAAEALQPVLKGKVRMCLASREIELLLATQYLNVHGNLPRMRTWKQDQKLPALIPFGKDEIILKKVENSA